VARGYDAQGEFATLTFLAVLDGDRDFDTITIGGRPDLEVKLQGTNGDIATVAIAVNAIRRVLEAPPGLVTMRDLPLVSWW
jgi:4-hydroxy-tetrahydrodipicolinate reductase